MEKYTYKESGVEWLGVIPVHWDIGKVKRGCSEIDTGKTPSTSVSEYFFDGSVEWYAPECFNETLWIDEPKKLINQKAVDDGQIKIYPAKSVYFVAVGATAGKVGIISKPASCNQQINILQTNHKLLPEYLTYQFKLLETEIIKFAQYTTLPILNQAKTGVLEMSFPPIQEQKAIAEYLDIATAKIDRIISIKQEQLVKMKASKKSKIEHLFSYDKDCKSIKKDDLEYLGYVPKDWKVTQLKFVLDFLDSRRIPLSGAERGVMTEKTYDYYGASGVIDKVDNYIFDEPLILIGEDGANLVTRSKTLAFIAKGKYWVNNHAHILKPKFGDIEFWTYLLESLDYSLFITGAAQPKLSQGNLAKMRIKFPKEESKRKVILDKIVKLEQTTKKQQINLKSQIKTLQTYRKSLIHECVTGKKQVTSAIKNQAYA
ncbi:restriction endonuclease subunit S [uncultured Polaribacter sp.]|uniref:restriction endonuclease subunit S n=1 Tax=uncultured Polaribacter sp. TaxID=174711 RepID=UPI00261B6F30|nr:restriction endonuclease subunit S [uncultured Polaribacter sp.]